MPANQYHIPVGFKMMDLDLPTSGGKVQVRLLSMDDIIGLDIMDQLDMFGGIVQEDHIDRVKKPQDRKSKKPTKAQQSDMDDKAVMELFQDKNKFRALSTAIDRAIVKATLQPSLALAYTVENIMVDGQIRPVFTPMDDDPETRGGEGVWTDQIPLDDKMIIFGSVLPGGEGLQKFREGSREAMGDLADVAEDAGDAE